MLFSFSVIRATSELGSSADRSNSVRVSGHEEEFVVKRKRGTVGGHLVGKIPNTIVLETQDNENILE